MAKLTNASGKPSTGVVPYVVMAVVVDNNDPEKFGRVKVKYPTLANSPESHWLRQVAPAGGKAFGFYSLPEVGDEVLVAFLQGSQDAGIIVGSLWNGADLPPAEAESPPEADKTKIKASQASEATYTQGSGTIDANDRRLWRSRSGHLILLDDTDGAESLQIWDGGRVMSLAFDTASKAITLANAEGDLHIRTAGDLYLEAGGKVIVASGDNTELTVGADLTADVSNNAQVSAGMNIEISAGTNLEADAGANIELAASANFTAKGVMATLEGSGTVKVKGGAMAEVAAGIVKIN